MQVGNYKFGNDDMELGMMIWVWVGCFFLYI